MTKRKAVSPKVRFEVFKRDSFTCQYCGAKAPDVLLHADHIEPVSKGGANDIMNLITACRTCNGGKGAVQISDQGALEKQRSQLEELNERREQIEMMLKWRGELQDLTSTTVESLCQMIERLGGSPDIHPTHLKMLTKLVRAHDLDDIIRALEDAFDRYADGTISGESAALNNVERFTKMNKACRDKPYLKRLMFIRASLRKRLRYIPANDDTHLLTYLEDAHLSGVSLDDLDWLAGKVAGWTQFTNSITAWIKEKEGPSA